MRVEPYRGEYGDERPARLAALALPGAPMPAFLAGRPRHRWRYVGVYDAAFSVIVGDVRVAGMRQSFWGLWDRREPGGPLLGRTSSLRHRVVIDGGNARVTDGDVHIDVSVDEVPGVEVVGPSGDHHAWTRKQAGIPARVRIIRGQRVESFRSHAVVDDSDGYHARHLAWRWSIGVGRAADGRPVAWNLVTGIHDYPTDSERTVWVEGAPREVGPVRFADGLGRIDFAEGGSLIARLGPTRVADDNRLLVRSRYRQPFADFSGELPGVGAISGHGVMEEHSVYW